MQLPLIYREAITLHYSMGLSYSEIARALAISEETVRTRLRRALEQLRKRMN
jgi:RNA polymerase sigma-70 factor (ECF subfamily)